MNALSIRLFGTLEIHHGADRLRPFPTHKSRSLFCYLVLHPHRAHAREMLADTFWGERSGCDSRKCLRTELWRIRNVLAPSSESAALTSLREDRVEFTAPADCWIDVVRFEALVGELQNCAPADLTPADVASLREAVALYRGHLLEDNYDEWCLYLRERLRLLHFNALSQLLHYSMEHAHWSSAIEFGERLLQNDPLLESVHRSLMRCHYLMGNRARALQQFAACRRLLELELNVAPMRDTLNLAEQIRSEASPPDNRDDGRAAGVRERALLIN